MQESIIALGALAIITLIAVNQQRNNMLAREQAYLLQMETIAADLGKKRLEEISSRTAFDETRVGATSLDIDVNTLTTAGNLGPETGESDPSTFDDFDDYHGYRETVRHSIENDTLGFVVSYAVRYINPANPTKASSSRTLTKELTVRVLSQDSLGSRAAQFSASTMKLAFDDL